MRSFLKSLHDDSSGPAAAEWMLVTGAVFLLCSVVSYYAFIILKHLFYRAAGIISMPFG